MHRPPRAAESIEPPERQFPPARRPPSLTTHEKTASHLASHFPACFQPLSSLEKLKHFPSFSAFRRAYPESGLPPLAFPLRFAAPTVPEGERTSDMTTTTLAASGSSALVQRALAAFLGLFIVGFVGFSQLEAVHNAGHDHRHSMAFPCH
jgi:cobalt transporter subunit CbtB